MLSTSMYRRCHKPPLWKRQAFGSDTYIGRANQRHHQGRKQSDVIVLLFTQQINGDCPQGEDGQSLVAPGEVSPDNLEAFGIAQAIHQHTDGEQEERDADEQTLGNGTLVDVQEIGCYETGRTESRITTGNRSRHDTQNSQDATERT